MREIRILVGNLNIEAELNDTKTAQLIWDALPIEARANLWGDEIYFKIPVKTGLEPDSREIVSKGEIGYWPEGNAFCIFFGPTPVSKGEEIRAASRVNLIGKVLSNPEVFRRVQDGERIKIIKGK